MDAERRSEDVSRHRRMDVTVTAIVGHRTASDTTDGILRLINRRTDVFRRDLDETVPQILDPFCCEYTATYKHHLIDLVQGIHLLSFQSKLSH